MTIDPLIFFDIIIALFILSFSLAVMAVAHARILKKFNSHQKRYDEMVKDMSRKDADILEDARDKAEELLGEATDKAARIISQSQEVSDNSRKSLDSALDSLVKQQTTSFEKTSQEFLEEYKKELSVLRNKTIEITQTASKGIEQDSEKELKDFENVLAQETFSAQKIVEGKIEEEFAKAQKQVEEYKGMMVKKVDDDVYKMLENISKIAFGKSIPLSEHEKLIMEALENSKKDGIKT